MREGEKERERERERQRGEGGRKKERRGERGREGGREVYPTTRGQKVSILCGHHSVRSEQMVLRYVGPECINS